MRTYREMETRVARAPEPQRRSLRTAQPLAVVVASKTAPMRFQQMDAPTRQKIAQQAAEVPKFREQRNRWESTPEVIKAPAPQAEHRAAAPGVEGQKTVTPPQRPESLTPSAPVPAGQRREPLPSAEPKVPAATPPQRREPSGAPTAQPKGPETPRVEPPIPPAPARPERHEPPAAERKPEATPPPERREPSAPAAEPRVPAPAAREPRPTQSERIKTPPSPIVGRPAEAGEKGPPSRPTNERQDKPDARESRPDPGGRKGN